MAAPVISLDVNSGITGTTGRALRWSGSSVKGVLPAGVAFTPAYESGTPAWKWYGL